MSERTAGERSRLAQLREQAVELREKYLRVAATPDGMDVIIDILLRAYWVGTLDNPSKVALHNLANEIVAFMTDTMGGGDYQTPMYASMLRAAIGRAMIPAQPPQFPKGARDRGRA